MARTTAGKLADKTAAAAKRVTDAVTRQGSPPAQRSPAGAAKRSASPTAKKTAKRAGKEAAPVSTTEDTTVPGAKKASAAQKAPAPARKGSPAAKKAASAAQTPDAGVPDEAAPPVKGSAPKRSAAKRSAAKRSAASKGAGSGGAGAKGPAKGPAKKPARKPTVAAKGGSGGPPETGSSASAVASAASQSPEALPVKEGEDPWTTAELDEVRDELTADVVRLRAELELATRELDDLMRDAGDGAGNDQADVGSTTFERDHELSLANNARDMLQQSEHALERIGDGSYGVCENCGQPVGKNRLMAFPRATLCLTCKQREERR